MSAHEMRKPSDLEEWSPRWRDRDELRKLVLSAKTREWIKDAVPNKCPQRLENKRARMGY